MRIRIRIGRDGLGKTLLYEFHTYPTPAQVMKTVSQDHPGWSVVGFCEDDQIRKAVNEWIKKKNYLDFEFMIDGSKLTYNGQTFGMVKFDGPAFTLTMYNYDYRWGVNNAKV